MKVLIFQVSTSAKYMLTLTRRIGIDNGYRA
jgi:hypothetical protein